MARCSTGASGSLLESESSMVQELQQQIIIFSHQIFWLTPTPRNQKYPLTSSRDPHYRSLQLPRIFHHNANINREQRANS